MIESEVLNKLIDRTSISDGCWEWTHYKNNYGYGVMRWKDQARLAHRMMYETLAGPIPDGLTLDHLCRNRLCVNPSHLEPVSRGENVLRGDGISARERRQTHCRKGHAFDEVNTYRGQGRRRCRACARAQKRKANGE